MAALSRKTYDHLWSAVLADRRPLVADVLYGYVCGIFFSLAGAFLAMVDWCDCSGVATATTAGETSCLLRRSTEGNDVEQTEERLRR